MPQLGDSDFVALMERADGVARVGSGETDEVVMVAEVTYGTESFDFLYVCDVGKRYRLATTDTGYPRAVYPIMEVSAYDFSVYRGGNRLIASGVNALTMSGVWTWKIDLLIVPDGPSELVDVVKGQRSLRAIKVKIAGAEDASGENATAFDSAFGVTNADFGGGFAHDVKTVRVAKDRISVIIHDDQYWLDEPAQQAAFSSVSDELDGTPIPAGYGRVDNAPTVYIGTDEDGKPRYEVVDNTKFGGDELTEVTVYEGQLALTVSDDYSRGADGEEEHGIITLENTPTFPITVDFKTDEAGSSSESRTELFETWLKNAMRYDVGGAQLSPNETFGTPFSTSEVGLYWAGEELPHSMLERAAAPLGIYHPARSGTPGSGAIRIQELPDPRTVTPHSVTIPAGAVRGSPEIILEQPAVWKWTVRYQHNPFVVTDDQVAGAATVARRSFAQNEWRTLSLSDGNIQTQWENTEEIEVQTPAMNRTDAAAEARYCFDLFRYPSRVWRVPIHRWRAYVYQPGDVVTVELLESDEDDDLVDFWGLDTSGEYQLEDGSGGYQLEDGSGNYLLEGATTKNFAVVGLQEDWLGGNHWLDLWAPIFV